ncbi:MAG: excinuclease ABC subunit C [Terracidiphilus sp.]
MAEGAQTGTEVAGQSYATINEIAFDPAQPKTALAQLPREAAVFALYGADERAEPYIGRTPNLRGRLERLLQPSEKHPRRLQLASRVRRIAWQLTGSEFESLLLQFGLLQKVYGTKCLERMHLRPPAFVRFLGSNQYPRVVVTHRPSQREADWAYGPFPSRAAAERYVDEVLKLFLLRRCTDDLNPDPAFPGCVYSEMKMCLAPCFKGCTDERYAEESAAVESFFATRGESRLVTLRAQREQASADLEFETAAAIHAQVQKVDAVRALAAELVRPMSRLRAVILQPSAAGPTAPSHPSDEDLSLGAPASATSVEVSVFLYQNGCLRGPAAFSTVGMRIQNEQSGSTSLFAQPLAIEAVPEIRDQGSENNDQAAEKQRLGIEGPRDSETKAGGKAHRTMLEARLEDVLATLSAEAHEAPSATVRQGHLALLKRWYYRPEAKRSGEIFFPDGEGRWPIRAILRGIGRVAAKAIVPQPGS